MADSEILDKIPHRPPFLWIDKIICQSESQIETEKLIKEDLDIFKGHYPGYPILPGVILCEAAFQSGALLIAETVEQVNGSANQLPVVTRILKAKFKREVRPGDRITIRVILSEKVGPAWFMKARVLLEDGSTALNLEFACTLKKASNN